MKGIFYWLKDSAKMKRWIMLILVGVVFASFGMAELITPSKAITFTYATKIIVYFVIGFTCVVLGIVYINKRNMELFIEATDNRIEGKKKVNVNSLIFDKTIYNQGPKVVVIGGGSGLNTILEGLKKYTSNITAVVTISDYGESFGKNSETMLYRQLEDIKNSFAALRVDDYSEMKKLLDYKFAKGKLKGLTFSDLYFSTMCDLSGNVVEAIKNSNDIFKICGRVLPITREKMTICAELDNGYMVDEKARVPEMVYNNSTKINRVYLSPSNCSPLPEVIKAIREADGIIIGPGSLYENVIPNLLVKGVARAIKESKAVKLYVCNIMTEPGFTDDFTVSDYLNVITDHCGEELINYCLYDTGEVMPEFIKKYNLEGSNLVIQDLSKVKDKRIKFIKENMSVIKDGHIRHNAMIVADTLIKIICDDLKYQDKHNEIEYMLMDSKLQVDKQIKKENERRKRLLKYGKTIDDKKVQSKFATKYKERIQSIKDSDKNKKIKSKT